jgi:hypothetical protein
MFVGATLFLSVMLGQPFRRQDHRQLDWTAAGGCVVEFVHTPCRTVRYHEYSFGSGSGFDRISTSETIEATDHSGSASKTTVERWRRWWQLPGMETRRKVTELVLRTEDRVVYIDHQHRVFESHAGANRKWSYWEEDDSECSHAASHYLYLSGRLSDSNMASVHVVGYRGRDAQGADYEVYFAPSIGCQQMNFKMLTRGFLGLVTAEYDMIVDSYELGAPAASLYSVPTEYKQVASILPQNVIR